MADDDGLIIAKIVQVLPTIRETSGLPGEETVPWQEWKRCLVNANNRIAEFEEALRAIIDRAEFRLGSKVIDDVVEIARAALPKDQ